MKKLLIVLVSTVLTLQLIVVPAYGESFEEFPELSEDTTALSDEVVSEITSDGVTDGEVTSDDVIIDDTTAAEDDLIDVTTEETTVPTESTVPPPATTVPAGAEVPFSATLYVTGGTVNVRSDTSTLGVVLGKLSVGEEVQVIAKVNANGLDWYKFSYKGNTAYAIASVFGEKKETTTSTASSATLPPEVVTDPVITETVGTEITTPMETLPEITSAATTTTTEASTTTVAGGGVVDKDNTNNNNSSGVVIAAVVAFLVLALGISVPLLIRYFRHKKIYEY